MLVYDKRYMNVLKDAIPPKYNSQFNTDVEEYKKFYGALPQLSMYDSMGGYTKKLYKSEIFSLGKILIYLYLGYTFDLKITYYVSYIAFNLSILSSNADRVIKLNSIDVWPQKGDYKYIDGVTELIASMINGNFNLRPTLDELLNNKIFTNNANIGNIKGVYTIVSLPENDEYVNLISRNQIVYLITRATYIKMQLFQLLKALPLFYKLVFNKNIYSIKTNLRTLYKYIFMVSLLLVSNRIDQITLDKVLEGFKIKPKSINDDIYTIMDTMLKESYIYLDGYILHESTVDYGSIGNVDYRAILYYTDSNLMLEHSPSSYVAIVEKNYGMYKAEMIKNRQTVIIVPKNIDLLYVSVKIRKLISL